MGYSDPLLLKNKSKYKRFGHFLNIFKGGECLLIGKQALKDLFSSGSLLGKGGAVCENFIKTVFWQLNHFPLTLGNV